MNILILQFTIYYKTSALKAAMKIGLTVSGNYNRYAIFWKDHHDQARRARSIFNFKALLIAVNYHVN